MEPPLVGTSHERLEEDRVDNWQGKSHPRRYRVESNTINTQEDVRNEGIAHHLFIET
jgi:hypothetical protein